MVNKEISKLNKLILLFVFDKMELPLSENTIIDICCSTNTWISYMDCKPTINKLLENSFIINVSQYGDELYEITVEGRKCLSEFYTGIPEVTREQIAAFVKINRTRYRKKQEYTADYYMNKDSTYTVFLKIHDVSKPLMELKFAVPDRQQAKNIYKKWEQKANKIYELLFEELID